MPNISEPIEVRLRISVRVDTQELAEAFVRESDYETVGTKVTKELVEKHFSAIGTTEVERHELPQLSALNFVLHNALNGGVTRSISLDIHGKTLSALMLELEI